MKTATVGVVSEATLRTYDLTIAFLDELENLDPDKAGEIRSNVPDGALDNPEHDWWVNPHDSLFDLDDLFEALDELAPIGCYFGSHDGDGALFGFFPDWQWLEDAQREGERVDDERVRFDGVTVHVSDHGNVSVYDENGNSLWGAV